MFGNNKFNHPLMGGGQTGMGGAVGTGGGSQGGGLKWGNLWSGVGQGLGSIWDNTMGVTGLGGSLFGADQGGMAKGWLGQAWDNTHGK